MGIEAIKFEHRDGVEWVGWQQPNGDTTTDYVAQVKAGPDWELFRPAYEAWQAELIDTGDERASKQAKKQPDQSGEVDMTSISFEVRDGSEWGTWTTTSGDTTSDQVERMKTVADWETTFKPAYDAWKAGEGAKKGKAKDEAKAEPAPAVEPPDDNDDDKSGTRRTLAKGYRK